jgi:hypothetical protein
MWGLHRELEHIPGGEFQQWHIIAAPGHPFLKAVIETVLRNIDRYQPWFDGTGREGIFRLTGPIAYTLAIAPLLDRHDHRLVANEREIGLEYSILSGIGHQKLFRSHYLTNSSSLIQMTGSRRPLAALYSFAVRLRRMAGMAKRAARGEAA